MARLTMERTYKELGTIPAPLKALWKTGMKRIVVFTLLVLFVGRPTFGGPTPSDLKVEESLRSNVIDFRDWLMKQLFAFPKTSQTNNSFASRSYAGLSKRNTCFTADQFNQARKSDWAKSQVMDGLSTLSQQLAKTAGTAFALNSANQLNQYAAQLKQSDDPEFQKIGILYTQEAQALQSGNIQAADQAANQVSAVPKPYVPPGYQPTQGESQLVSAFNQVIGSIIGGLGGILGTFAVSQILQALGIPNLSSLLGTGQVAGTSLATGQNPSRVADNTGANVVYTGGSAVMNQLGSVNLNPRQSQNSTNAGGPPSAQ